MPSIGDVINALAEDAAYAARGAASAEGGSPGATAKDDVDEHAGKDKPPPPLPPHALLGRTLPLLFIRARDGVGYHSGRTIALENVFAQMEMNPHGPPPPGVDPGWIAAAQAAAGGPSGMEMSGWTLRVM